MIENIKVCTIEETQFLGEYILKYSYVKNVGKSLLEGNLILKSGCIYSLNKLGALKTMTGHIDESAIIGPKIPNQPTAEFQGDRKFLVKEILPSLQGKDVNDNGHIETIERYMSMIIKNEHIDIIVSSIEYNKDYMIIDGNKRTVAFFEIMKRKGINEIDFPIYILSYHSK